MSDCRLRVGYACINLSLDKKYRTFRLKALEDKDINKIREVVENNLFLLGDIIHYNIKHNIYVYRITADLIPFMDKPEMKAFLEEHEILKSKKILGELNRIREWQEKYKLSLSMHTSHFTMLASPKEEIVEKSVGELKAQSEFLRLINGKNLVLHVGGAYGDKEATLLRLKDNLEKYKKDLDFQLLTFENDDKTYTSSEVVAFCKEHHLKWVYDYHHERCNPSIDTDVVELIRSYPPDKYHLSTGVDGEIKPPHADYISKEDIKGFIAQLTQAGIKDAEVIFEAKKKDLAIYDIMEPVENGYWRVKDIN